MADKKTRVQSSRKRKSQNNDLGNGMTISDLNDDCLRCILAHLSFKDKVKLQRVSKRWQLLMPWNKWNGKKKLNIERESFMLGYEGWLSYSLPVLKKVLELCGNFIIDIEISDLYIKKESTPDNVLKLLKELCPNLVCLNLSGIELTKPLIQYIIQNFDKLTSISIGLCAENCENEVHKLFSELKNLHSVEILNSNIKGRCLFGLPFGSIVDFQILGSEDLQLTNLSKAFQRMRNLQILSLAGNLHLIENIDKLLKDLPDRSELEYLQLHIIEFPLDALFMPFDRENLVQMKNVCYLTNLQKLILHGTQVVHDEALTIIGNTCKRLKIAYIIDSIKLTDAGWQNFAKLTNIEELTIGQLEKVTHKCLLCLPSSSLKILICYKIDLTNKSLKFLLNSAKKLDMLDVALCPKVNYTTLVKDASVQIESRPKHEILNLHIDTKKINRKVKNISSRLRIRQTNCYFVKVEELAKKSDFQTEMTKLITSFQDHD